MKEEAKNDVATNRIVVCLQTKQLNQENEEEHHNKIRVKKILKTRAHMVLFPCASTSR